MAVTDTQFIQKIVATTLHALKQEQGLSSPMQCPLPVDTVKEHSELLKKLNDNVIMLNGNVETLNRDIKGLEKKIDNNNVSLEKKIDDNNTSLEKKIDDNNVHFVAKAKENRDKIDKHENRITVMETEKKTMIALVGSIIANLIALLGLAFAIYTALHSAIPKH